MKKALLTLGLILALTSPLYAADGDISQVEVRPDVASWELDTIKLLRFTETAIITYRKVDATGASLGEEFDVTFVNIADDPSTLDVDESNPEFTQFYNYIHTQIRADDSLKTAIMKACKIKLGIN